MGSHAGLYPGFRFPCLASFSYSHESMQFDKDTALSHFEILVLRQYSRDVSFGIATSTNVHSYLIAQRR